MVIGDDHEGLYSLDHQRLYGVDYQSSESHQSSESMNTESDDVNAQLKSRRMSSESEEDGLSKKFRTSPEFNSNSEVQDTELIGLTLSKTPSFVNLLESKLSQVKMKNNGSARRVGRPSNSSRNMSNMEDFAIVSEKLKAANFPAIKLTIGVWERVSKHEGDLIAKCYYAKRKLVWEHLDGPLKSKIEIQWSDIIAIRAIMPPGEQPGLLEIELKEPPTFHRETNPQPRKHTLWQQTSDFTGGQAPIHRRHCVRFAPGVLDKHYEKLLRCDARLNELSKKPFPSQLCPFFEQPDYNDQVSIGNDYGSQLLLNNMHYPFHHLPSSSSTALIPNVREPLRQFSSYYPVAGENISELWGGQGSNNMVNVAMGNQTIGMLPAGSTPDQQADWITTTQDHQAMYLQNDSIGNGQENHTMLNYLKNYLLEENQVTSNNEPAFPYSLPEDHENRSLAGATGDVHSLNSSYQMLNNNYAENVVPNYEMAYMQPNANWMFPQQTNDQFSANYATVSGGYPTQDVNQEAQSVWKTTN